MPWISEAHEIAYYMQEEIEETELSTGPWLLNNQRFDAVDAEELAELGYDEDEADGMRVIKRFGDGALFLVELEVTLTRLVGKAAGAS